MIYIYIIFIITFKVMRIPQAHPRLKPLTEISEKYIYLHLLHDTTSLKLQQWSI